MKILVINCGSSSLKYQLMNMDDESVICKGLVERIGIEGSKLTHKVEGRENFVVEEAMKNHKDAMKHVFDALVSKEHGVVASLDEIDGIGHRVLHGGDIITDSTLVTEDVKKTIEKFICFGPLHNPANLMGIEACEELVKGKPNVVVMDTAFHQTMPAKNYMYAIDYDLYEKYRLRKYGFHGTSHKYIAHRMAEILNKDLSELNIINCHLGNGSSLACIKNGKVYDTSMGVTPLEGLVMGTRSGDIDPTVVTFLCENENITPHEANQWLNKKSGVLGVSKLSSDFRDLEEARDKGNEKAGLALDMFTNRVKKYIGAYMAQMPELDAIVMTGGIGENSDTMRREILHGLEHLGIELDDKKNDGTRAKEVNIAKDGAKIKIYICPTNEELMIARDTKEIISK
ncbi:acetate kinase [Fenollaria massiliensis]|uniref:Acetate kinase n=1 Tax=Fenollaria massiliensis TaxID=938288 RepID=A0A9E7DKI8_9FIRM|nr:acetate kinase [Fenollaria massiliensis]UQK59653.1 acetate kinase [Fenollaria massiliensis]